MYTILFTLLLILLCIRAIYLVYQGYKNKGCHNCDINQSCSKTSCSNPLVEYYHKENKE